MAHKTHKNRQRTHRRRPRGYVPQIKDPPALNNCPRCGAYSRVDTKKEKFYNGYALEYRVICSNCKRKTRFYVDKEDALKAWNELPIHFKE